MDGTGVNPPGGRPAAISSHLPGVVMRTLLPLVVAVGLLVTAVTAQENAGDLKKMQGTWSVEKMVENGREAPAKDLKGIQMTIRGHNYHFTGGEENYKGYLRIDSSKKPKQLEATFVESNGEEKGRALGIYELQGDTLKMCWRHEGKDRPTEFASERGSGTRYVVLKRDRR